MNFKKPLRMYKLLLMISFLDRFYFREITGQIQKHVHKRMCSHSLLKTMKYWKQPKDPTSRTLITIHLCSVVLGSNYNYDPGLHLLTSKDT